jgi:hypothetical protein
MELASLVQEVITIERDSLLAERAIARIRAAGLSDRVKSLQGESAAVLRDLLPSLNRSALFWLDAHWFSSMAESKLQQCGLLDELGVISRWGSCARSVLLIDDVHLFMRRPLGGNYRQEEWPDLAELQNFCAEHFPCHAQAISDDVLYIVPMPTLATAPSMG